jgi:hypothetical protein
LFHRAVSGRASRVLAPPPRPPAPPHRARWI